MPSSALHRLKDPADGIHRALDRHIAVWERGVVYQLRGSLVSP